MTKKTKAPPSSVAKLKSLASSFGRVESFKTILTGIHPLDLALGNGIPRGRIIEIFGSESAGKSLMGWEILKAFQKIGGETMLLGNEATEPERFMRAVGMDLEKLAYERPETVEQHRDLITQFVTGVRKVSDAPIAIMWDSIAGTSAEKEWDDEGADEFGGEKPRDNDMASRAASLSNFFKQHTTWMAKNDVTLICINQLREKIGVMFGKKTDSPGGRALKFFASIRIELSRGKKFERGGHLAGADCYLTIEKNKCARPARKALLRINWNEGYDRTYGLGDLLVEAGRVKDKKGGTYAIGEETFTMAEWPAISEKHPELMEPWI